MDLLAKAGITPESYNIVMQGDVTRIIEMTAVERRKIIDEIAGVAEFDEKKKKALEELDVVRERVERVDVILEEVGGQLDRLRAERDKAHSYQAHKDELKRQEAFLLLARLKEASRELESLNQEISSLQDKNDEIKLRADEDRSELAVQERSCRTSVRRLPIRRGRADRGQAEDRGAERELARETSKIQMAEKALNDLDRQQNASFIQLGNLSGEEEVLAEKIRDASIRKASLEGELEDQNDLLQQAEESLSREDAQFSALREELERARGTGRRPRQSLETCCESETVCWMPREGGPGKRGALRAIKEAMDALAGSDHEADQLKEELAGLNSRAMELEKDRDDWRAQGSGCAGRLPRQIGRCRSCRASSPHRRPIKAAEDKGGFSRAVDAIRTALKKDMLPGLYGTVAELGNVQSRFSVALEVAAGARMQSIVAATDEDAARPLNI